MTIPHPHININARALFKRIYQNEKINLDASKKTLEDQLNLYLDHLGTHLNKKISPNARQHILSIIHRNNDVAAILKAPEYLKISQNMRDFLNGVALGLVFCIDGRIPAIFIGGRFALHWEIPAAKLKVTKRKSDGNIIPESSELCEALRLLVSRGKEVIEIVFAHTSLLNPSHGCGAMETMRKNGIIKGDISNEEANLKIIESVTIPALTNLYNEFRLQKGFEPLKTVGISALYDTDTFGIILNYDKNKPANSLSTTDLTNKYKEALNDYLIKDNLVFGSFSERFSYLKYLTAFSQNVLKITSTILKNEPFEKAQNELSTYIKKSYPGMTAKQQGALQFFLARAIAMQYLTGSSSITKKTQEHPFTHHEEQYMAVSTRGTTIGKFDPQDQGFSSTPSDAQSAVLNIKTKLSIMNQAKHDGKQSKILFICNPVNKRDLKENSIQLHKIMDANAELSRAIVADKALWEMIREEKIILTPVLIEEDTREVLKIIDHSAYI